MLKQFLDSRVSPRPLGVARIGFGLLCLLKTFDLASRLPEKASSAKYAKHLIKSFPEGWHPYLSPSLAPWLLILWAVLALGLTLGYRSRACAALISSLVAYILLADARLHNQHFYLIGLLGFLFALSRCDVAFSIRGSHRFTTDHEGIPAWPVFLIKAQMSIVYAFAAITKIKINIDFLAGHTIHEAMMTHTFAKMLFPYAMRESVAVCIFIATLSITVEAWLAVGLWFSRTRALSMTLGFFFHIGLIVFVHSGVISGVRLIVFGGLLLVLYVLFIGTSEPAGMVIWSKKADRPPLGVAFIRVFDWLQVFEYQATESENTPQVVLRDRSGRTFSGWGLVAAASPVMPLTAYVSKVLVLIGVSRLIAPSKDQ